MKRIVLFVAVTICLLTSCTTNCNEKLKELYSKNQKALIRTQEVNGFMLTMTFLPSRLLPKYGEAEHQKDSTAYYYFKLQVQCPPSTPRINTVSLNYGLDSLFSARDSILSIPTLVEPVITGRQQFYEYLLVFTPEDFEKDPRLKVFFLDRLFTNTRLAFEFDRSIIEEIETLSCYATKA
jgi:hypothetical protein